MDVLYGAQMRHAPLALIGIIACGRERSSYKPVPQGGSYQELITSVQSGSATETRNKLDCAESIQISPQRETPICKIRTQKQIDEFNTRFDAVNAMTVARLVRDATDAELVGVVTDRLNKSNLLPPERNTLLVLMHDAEVLNGGHHQLFFNSSGDHAIETREALTEIELTDILAIYDCALTAFPNSRPDTDRLKRGEQLARWGAKQFEIFGQLDKAYWATSSLVPAVAAYVRRHATDFPHVEP
jgi:hypothetical protein